MRRWYMCFLCLFCVQCVFAQEQDQAEKAKIKEIKLSGNYYYADITMDKEKDALELALRNLILTIQSDLSVGKGIEACVKEKWQHIALSREGKRRVFAYVYKGDVDDKFAEEAGAVVGTGEERDTVADAQANDVVREADTTAVAVAGKVEGEVRDSVAGEMLGDAGMQRGRDTVVIVRKDTVVVSHRDTIVVREVVTGEKSGTTGNPMLDQILTFKKIEDLQRYFVRKKEEGKLMFGKLDSAVTPEKCYMVIFSRSGEVVAILDKGVTNRRNLTSGAENDHVDNYRGYGKVWFQLY